MTTKAERAETAERKADAIAQLREMLPPGTEVRTILRHVSRSGMRRVISVTWGDQDWSWLVARALGTHIDQRHGGITRDGCGMDMGQDLVMSLSRALHDDLYAITSRWL